ncbi:MAG: FtsB family cell division protein [Pyrinomonadaceae bacterium]
MRVANTYWTDNRLAAQRVNPHALTMNGMNAIHTSVNSLPFPEITPAITETQDVTHAVRRLTKLLSSWTLLAMVIVAFLGICLTVNRRANAELTTANQQIEQMRAEVNALHEANVAIERDVNRLRSDPRAIEVAARKRLNMVRPDEVVFTIE